jgi:hypothetical protein
MSRPLPEVEDSRKVVGRIESAPASVGAFGEVRLAVVKGRMRCIETVRSEGLAGSPQAQVAE